MMKIPMIFFIPFLLLLFFGNDVTKLNGVYTFFNYYQHEKSKCDSRHYFENLKGPQFCNLPDMNWWRHMKNFSNANSGLKVEKYNVKFEFSNNLKHYCGQVKIFFRVLNHRGVKNIVFHSKKHNLMGIAAYDTKYENEFRSLIKIDDICVLIRQFGHHLIRFDQELNFNNTYMLDITFNGYTKSLRNGFQLIKPNEINNQSQPFLISLFHPNHAREAFPCFDDPSMKARFVLQLIHPASLNSYSNTPISKTTKLSSKKKLVVFEETPPMSPYMLTFSINDYPTLSIITNTTNKFNVTLILPKPYIHYKKYIFPVVYHTLSIMEFHTNVPYQLQKLDIIGIYGFHRVSLGNWGLLFFDIETMRLMDKNEEELLHATKMIIHNIALQWVGNYVTPKSWNHVWLSEGLATFFHEYIYNRLFPNQTTYIKAQSFNYDMIMDMDASMRAASLILSKSTNYFPDVCYNERSYRKGSAVFRMLYQVIGEHEFFKVIQEYLSKFAYKSVITDDFIESITKTLETPKFGKMVYSWASYPGLTSFAVSLPIPSYRSILKISQSRFLKGVDKKLYGRMARKHSSPLFYKVKYDEQEEIKTGVLWIVSTTQNFKMNGNISWIMINRDRIGLYVSYYERPLEEALISALKNKSNSNILSPIEKLAVMSDTNRLSKNNYTSSSMMYDLINVMLNETDPYIVAVLINYMDKYIDRNKTFVNSTGYNNATYLEYLIDKYNKVKWSIDNANNSNYDEILLLQEITDKCVKYGCLRVLDFMFNSLTQWGDENNNLKYDGKMLKNMILTASLHGGSFHRKILERKRYETEDSKILKEIIIAFARVNDENALLKYLFGSIHFKLIPRRYLRNFFEAASTNPHGRKILWNFVRNNWEELAEKFNHNILVLSQLIYTVATTSDSNDIEREVKQFYDQHSYYLPILQYNKILESIKMRKGATK